VIYVKTPKAEEIEKWEKLWEIPKKLRGLRWPDTTARKRVYIVESTLKEWGMKYHKAVYKGRTPGEITETEMERRAREALAAAVEPVLVQLVPDVEEDPSTGLVEVYRKWLSLSRRIGSG